jgi:hypothetical protein
VALDWGGADRGRWLARTLRAMRPWMIPVAASVALVALLVTSAGLVVQTRRAAEAESRADELAAEVDELRAEVRALEERLERETAADGGLLDGCSTGCSAAATVGSRTCSVGCSAVTGVRGSTASTGCSTACSAVPAASPAPRA